MPAVTATVSPPPAVAAPSLGGPGRIGGLDGLRGLAVVAVVAYHLWPGVLPAGFLGVTLFFALSGYLITTLLLDEIERTGRVALKLFWARRLRRLMPASWVVLALVLAVWAAAGWLTDAIRGDVVWSALHAANWRRIVEAQAYGVSPEASPLLHFWSLSIEEQCYFVLPLLAAWAGSRRRLGTLLAGCFALSVVAVAWSWADPVTTYFSTFTRGGELVAGALAAVVVRGRRERSTRRADLGAALGVLAFMVAAAVTSLGSAAYARGGLLVAGVVAAATVAAVAASQRVGRLLDVRPLAWLGSVSYAVYLVHWPILVGLRAAGIDPHLAPWLTLAVTLPIAAASGRFLERPIRSGARLRRRPLLVAAAALGALVTAATVVPATSAQVTFDAERASELVDARRTELTTPPTPTAPPTSADGTAAEPPADAGTEPDVTSAPPAPAPVRYAWVSDSTGLPLVLGIRPTERFVVAGWWTQMGCPLGRGGRVRSASTGSAVWTTDEKGCNWDADLAAGVPEGQVDVALVAFGRWDAAERQVPALGDAWTTIDDPAYEAWLFGEMQALTAQLHTSGVDLVVWLTLLPDDDHAPRSRVDTYNRMLGQLAEQVTTGRVAVIDMAGWLLASGEVGRLLPDGVHTTFEPDGGTAEEIARRFLFPELERMLDEPTTGAVQG